jgi:para-nitrobenzyl esterase
LNARAAGIVGAEVLGGLGVSPGDDEALEALTDDQLIEAQRAMELKVLDVLAPHGVSVNLMTLATHIFTMPVYGTDVLPEAGLAAISGGAARDVDLLMGTNADECTLIMPAIPQPKSIADAAFATSARSGADVIGEYRRNRANSSELEALTAFMTDTMFRIPMIRMAEAAHRHGSRTHVYRFTWGTPPNAGTLGATHAIEVPYMWDTLDLLRGRGLYTQLVGKEPSQELAAAMHGAWAAFVKSGAPRHPSLPDWPAYEPTRRATMELDEETRVVDDPDGSERCLWDGVAY